MHIHSQSLFKNKKKRKKSRELRFFFKGKFKYLFEQLNLKSSALEPGRAGLAVKRMGLMGFLKLVEYPAHVSSSDRGIKCVRVPAKLPKMKEWVIMLN